MKQCCEGKEHQNETNECHNDTHINIQLYLPLAGMLYHCNMVAALWAASSYEDHKMRHLGTSNTNPVHMLHKKVTVMAQDSESATHSKKP